MAAPTLLPDAVLARPMLRHWQKGQVQAWTGAEFWGAVDRHAAWVAAHTPPGAFVLVIGHTGPQMMALFLGIAVAGRLGAYFPPASPIQDEQHFYEQQRAALTAIDPAAICVMDATVAATVRRIDASLGARVLDVPPADPAEGDARAALARFRARLDDDTPLFVQHSSGTTGIKKAVAITGRMLGGQFAAYWPKLRVDGAPLRVASWLPLYHDMGLIAAFLLPVLGGDTISIMDPFDWIQQPGSFLQMIEADGCDVCWMPNFAFRHFVRLRRALKPADLSGMRMWVDCSEPCRFQDALAFEESFAAFGVRPGSVVGCYAMAETVFAVSQCPPGERQGLLVAADLAPGADVPGSGARRVTQATDLPANHKLVLSSGRVVPGLELGVFDGATRLDEHQYGEIALRGPFLFDAYRGRDAASSGFDDEGWFRTGDLGCVLDDHVFVFGRLKEIIIVNGKNIFAGDVEASLGAIAGLRKGRVVAFGVDSAQTGSEELVVVAEHDEASGIEADAARMAISRQVSETFLVKPRDVQVVGDRWLVKSTSGKISRDENRRRYLEQFRVEA